MSDLDEGITSLADATAVSSDTRTSAGAAKPRRVRTLSVAICAVVAVAAAGVWWSAPWQLRFIDGDLVRQGHLVAAMGDGVVLPPLEPGTTTWRGVVIENIADTTITVTSIKAVDLPTQLHQVDVRIWNNEDTVGYYTSWYEGAGTPDEEPRAFKSRPLDRWHLDPLGPNGHVGDYPMVEIRIADDAPPGRYTIRDFVVRYELDGRTYQQALDKSFEVQVK